MSTPSPFAPIDPEWSAPAAVGPGTGAPTADGQQNPFATPASLTVPGQGRAQPPAPAGYPASLGYGGAPSQRPPHRHGAWPVVSLVSGLLALVPVAVAAGVIGIVQARRAGQPAPGLAIGGLVASGVWLLAGLGGLVVAAGWWLFQAPPIEAAGPASAVAGLRAGQCIDMPADERNPVSPVDCARAHDGEVFEVWTIPGPGGWTTEDVVATVDEYCWDAFGGYVGTDYESSRYGYWYYAADAQEWAAGERTATCVVTPWEDDVLVGSVRGSGR